MAEILIYVHMPIPSGQERRYKNLGAQVNKVYGGVSMGPVMVSHLVAYYVKIQRKPGISEDRRKQV